MKCPGQDSRYWKESDIFEIECPNCSHLVEFFKDDTVRKCNNCSQRLANPNLDLGCASYCEFADQCTGILPKEIKEKKWNVMSVGTK